MRNEDIKSQKRERASLTFINFYIEPIQQTVIVFISKNNRHINTFLVDTVIVI